MKQKCETCRLWKPPVGNGNWGLCKPGSTELPFWAALDVPDMQTQTRREEGQLCRAFKA